MAFIKNKQEERLPQTVSFSGHGDDGCDGYYNKGSWWDDISDTPDAEDAFDAYAREFHSLTGQEQDEFFNNTDNGWMMQ